ncbi:MAG: tetraacyldisaccharide 4'-kinase [Chitinophagales bacterium]
MNQLLRIVLLPASWLYGIGVFLRNKQFDLGIRKSVSFEIPVMVIGNLSAGGTGKTPLAEYLVKLLKEGHKTGVLSRGYRRRTKGYVEVNADRKTAETGDEPMQLKRKFPDVTVSVCESRVIGITTMIHEYPDLEVLILDDAFQHRYVKPGLSLLITDYNHPFTRDSLLPAGRLREPVNGAKRADAIIVSKCPVALNKELRENFKSELAVSPSQLVFFSFQKYGLAYEIFNPDKTLSFEKSDGFLLFCGIANPDSLVNYLRQQSGEVKLLSYHDHHPYSIKDLKEIHLEYSMLTSSRKILITTEKDAVRLIELQDYITSQQLEIYCMAVKTVFFEEDKAPFDEFITSFVHSFTPEINEE